MITKATLERLAKLRAERESTKAAPPPAAAARLAPTPKIPHTFWGRFYGRLLKLGLVAEALPQTRSRNSRVGIPS